MGAGKIFCILGGIIALVATFWISYMPNGYGLALWINMVTLFQSGDVLVIIMTIVFLFATLAGLFILIGIKSRALAIIGAIFAIAMGVYWMLSISGVLPIEVSQFVLMFVGPDLVGDIIPFDLMLGPYGLGTYLIVGGGVLGLIGGIMGPDEF